MAAAASEPSSRGTEVAAIVHTGDVFFRGCLPGQAASVLRRARESLAVLRRTGAAARASALADSFSVVTPASSLVDVQQSVRDPTGCGGPRPSHDDLASRAAADYKRVGESLAADCAVLGVDDLPHAAGEAAAAAALMDAMPPRRVGRASTVRVHRFADRAWRFENPETGLQVRAPRRLERGRMALDDLVRPSDGQTTSIHVHAQPCPFGGTSPPLLPASGAAPPSPCRHRLCRAGPQRPGPLFEGAFIERLLRSAAEGGHLVLSGEAGTELTHEIRARAAHRASADAAAGPDEAPRRPDPEAGTLAPGPLVVLASVPEETLLLGSTLGGSAFAAGSPSGTDGAGVDGAGARVVSRPAPDGSVWPHAVAVHRLFETGALGSSSTAIVVRTQYVCLREVLFRTDCSEGPFLSPSLQVPRALVVLDRDGVLNRRPSYRSGPEAIEPVPGAGAALDTLRAAGAAVSVLSSQSCVGYGFVTPGLVHETMDRLQQLLRDDAASSAAPPAERRPTDGAIGWLPVPCGHADLVTFSVGTGLKGTAVVPALADDGDAKPRTALVDLAREALRIPPGLGGFMAGDRLSDLATAVAAGLQPVLVLSGAGRRSLELLRRGEGPVDLGDCIVAESIVEASRAIVAAIQRAGSGTSASE